MTPPHAPGVAGLPLTRYDGGVAGSAWLACTHTPRAGGHGGVAHMGGLREVQVHRHQPQHPVRAPLAPRRWISVLVPGQPRAGLVCF